MNDTFALFDVDGSKTIDKHEAVNHWKGSFGKISAMEFFNSVDVNNDGEIEYEEFLDFWKVVKGSGHDEAEISEELEKLKNKESWCGFDNLPRQYSKQSKNV